MTALCPSGLALIDLSIIGINSASPYGEWGKSLLILCQSPPALSLSKNSNPSSFLLSPLPYAMFLQVFHSCIIVSSGAHNSATRRRELVSIRSTCPVHVYLLLLTSSLIVSMLALLCISSFETRRGQQIFKTLRRKVSSLARFNRFYQLRLDSFTFSRLQHFPSLCNKDLPR